MNNYSIKIIRLWNSCSPRHKPKASKTCYIFKTHFLPIKMSLRRAAYRTSQFKRFPNFDIKNKLR